ncbi:MAG: aminotransferase class I/II-fold pyridoxal phosphate-dependent enzyme [Planctomycetales bacterium]|nr:aminotransferase class I/II-fold pyridoxal phosphate-dependent enzyme [Planctomycetales bacterium]NIM07943.1 aminotransferase class I/II-fold pyridoxal phosphate-dependent enzyme [Planctomycetales bacterium]NIN07422.1 aminotransferase class I/II-fold pyridoxal phosphate-dependent enzyme [Planctomycetales bacterium]NIN76526.1 aminotransferase class I/II-fold pyridoxal phosphate-dependent enzyme [Planctomycetales bacterium]NIO33716.1 aminotransferase class I/II-fold pyridoxal phosphate-depende
MNPDQHLSEDPVDYSQPFQIDVATRVRRLPPYLFGSINALLLEKRRAGDDVIDLGMGNPSDPPEELVIEKLAEAARDARNHGYSKAQGIDNLRREVASKYLKSHGVRLDPDRQVIVCIGSKEGFSHMCLALMGSGDTAIVPAPYFPVHTYAVMLASGNAISLDVADSQRFLENVAYTCEHLYPRPKLLILNYPHNPTTVTVEPEFYLEVVKLARRYGFNVISDFAYADVAFDGYRPPSFLAAEGASEVGVEFTTMSKGYNMAGWRVGFCAGNADMIRALGTIKAYYDYGLFTPIQIAAIVALRHTEAAVESQSACYQGRRDTLCSGLQRLGWQVRPPRAGMFIWTKIPEPWAGKIDSIRFATMLLQEANVAVSPGAGFGPAGEGFLRLSLVENENRLRQAVRQIGRCLASKEATLS